MPARQVNYVTDNWRKQKSKQRDHTISIAGKVNLITIVVI